MARILHVSAVAFTLAKLIRPQIEYQASCGHTIHVACDLTDRASTDALSGLATHSVEFPRAIQLGRMWHAARQLQDVVRRVEPDIVHLHTPAAALTARLLPRSAYKAEVMAYTVHGFSHGWPPRSPLDRAVQWTEKLQARRTDLMFFVSKEDLEQAAARRYRSSLYYVGNGVDSAWFSAERRVRRGGPLRIAFVGRMVREKGVLDLLKSVEAVPDVELILAGDALETDRDSAVAEIRALVGSPRLANRVRFTGMLSPARVQEVLLEADVLCLPSYREGLPLSIIEAQATGLPCLVSDIRGCRELVQDGVQGYRFPPGDVTAISRALERMRDLSVESYSEMSSRALERARSEHRLEVVGARIEAGYGAALSMARSADE